MMPPSQGLNKSSLILGYDPGGSDCHGVASFRNSGSGSLDVACATLATAEHVIEWFRTEIDRASVDRVALGVDTLTVWSTGAAGYRPADRALRSAYPTVRSSVVAPNSLYGAMPINGLAVVSELRRVRPDLKVTETHPKVLYFALTNKKYDFRQNPAAMIALLAGWLGTTASSVRVTSEHEWDALISALAAGAWVAGTWQHDLHTLATAKGERALSPIGPTSFIWPTAVPVAPTNRPTQASPPQRSPAITWSEAVDRLLEAGHPDAARAVDSWANTIGNKGGWDQWFKSTYHELESIVFGDD